MAKRTICDRCKTEIIENNDFLSLALNVQFPVVCVSVSVADSLTSGFRDIDLCRNCKNELLEWIKDGKKEEADNGRKVNP